MSFHVAGEDDADVPFLVAVASDVHARLPTLVHHYFVDIVDMNAQQHVKHRDVVVLVVVALLGPLTRETTNVGEVGLYLSLGLGSDVTVGPLIVTLGLDLL